MTNLKAAGFGPLDSGNPFNLPQLWPYACSFSGISVSLLRSSKMSCNYFDLKGLFSSFCLQSQFRAHFQHKSWEITCCMSNKYVSQALFQTFTFKTTKVNFEELLGWQLFKNHNGNLCQSSSRLSISASFCICRVFYTFLELFERLF